MINAVAIDDEPISLDIIESFCNQFEFINLTNTFSSLDKAKKYLNKNEVDVIFLDVEMPSGNGIEFFKKLNKDIKIILITAHSKYALEGFNINAVDYLLKPFSIERFEEALLRVKKQLELENESQNENTHLTIKANYKLNNIPLEAIIRIEAMDDYIKIYTEDNDNPIVARYTMKTILDKLPKEQFIRVHKSHIVPLQKIISFNGQSIDLKDSSIPVGTTYKKKIRLFFPLKFRFTSSI